MSEFASGRHANAVCDICSVRTEYNDLKEVIRAGLPTNLYACTYCWDKDHPQLFLGRKPIKDPQTLRRARPDPSLAESRQFFDKAKIVQPPVDVELGPIRQSSCSAIQATLIRNGANNPYGVPEADVVVDNAVATPHAFSLLASIVSNANFTVSINVAPTDVVTFPDFIIRAHDVAVVNVAADAFSLGSRSYLGPGFSSGTGTMISRTVTLLPNGWANYSSTFNLGSGITSAFMWVAPRSTGTASYVGSGSQALKVWKDIVVS